MVAECLENLEEHRGQGMNEEVIRNVAGMVYLGEPVLLHTTELDLNISYSNGRTRSYPQVLESNDFQSDKASLVEFGAEFVLPSDGPQPAHSGESTKAVGRRAWWGKTARTLGYGPTSLYHRDCQGNVAMGSPTSPRFCPPVDGRRYLQGNVHPRRSNGDGKHLVGPSF